MTGNIHEADLEDLSPSQWEAICDGCAWCCLCRVILPGEEKVRRTSVACRLLDLGTCRCGQYGDRTDKVADCVKLTPELVRDCDWLPETCGYRRLANGRPLLDWHHLVCGDANRVHESGNSVRDRVISERDLGERDLVDFVVDP